MLINLVFIFLLNHLTPSQTQSCDNGWTLIAKKCVQYINTASTKSDGINACTKLCRTCKLIVVDSELFQNRVNHWIQNTLNVTVDIWHSGTVSSNEVVYLDNTDDSSTLNYTNWDENEPNVSSNRRNNCIKMQYKSYPEKSNQYQGKWAIVDCYDPTISVICQQLASTSTTTTVATTNTTHAIPMWTSNASSTRTTRITQKPFVNRSNPIISQKPSMISNPGINQKPMNTDNREMTKTPLISTNYPGVTQQPLMKTSNPGMTQKPMNMSNQGMTQKPMNMSNPEMTQKPMNMSNPGMTQKPMNMSNPEMTQKPMNMSNPEMTQKPMNMSNQGMTQRPLISTSKPEIKQASLLNTTKLLTTQTPLTNSTSIENINTKIDNSEQNKNLNVSVTTIEKHTKIITIKTKQKNKNRNRNANKKQLSNGNPRTIYLSRRTNSGANQKLNKNYGANKQTKVDNYSRMQASISTRENKSINNKTRNSIKRQFVRVKISRQS